MAWVHASAIGAQLEPVLGGLGSTDHHDPEHRRRAHRPRSRALGRLAGARSHDARLRQLPAPPTNASRMQRRGEVPLGVRPIEHFEVPHLALWKSAVSRVLATELKESRTTAAAIDADHPLMAATDRYCLAMANNEPIPEPRSRIVLTIRRWTPTSRGCTTAGRTPGSPETARSRRTSNVRPARSPSATRCGSRCSCSTAGTTGSTRFHKGRAPALPVVARPGVRRRLRPSAWSRWRLPAERAGGDRRRHRDRHRRGRRGAARGAAHQTRRRSCTSATSTTRAPTSRRAIGSSD